MKKLILSLLVILSVLVGAGALFFVFRNQEKAEMPADLLMRYFSYVENKQYDKMYSMLDEQSKQNYNKEEFITRNKNIYEGIDEKGIRIKITDTDDSEDIRQVLTYTTTFNSNIGKISFKNTATFTKSKEAGYQLTWWDSLIFPDLDRTDKVRVLTDLAERGKILDRNGMELAGKGIVTSVGLVPGRMKDDPEKDIQKLSDLLGISYDSIKKKLEAKWVKDDTFVPIKNIQKLNEVELLKEKISTETLKNKKLQDELISIEGVMLSDTKARIYPFGEAASHLTGYVQAVTAEDLEKHHGEDYNSNSVIGKSDAELLYEKELKGKNGHSIIIVNSKGKEKKVLAKAPREDGKDITLTIDTDLQSALYEQFENDKSCSVALNPYTGEVLALVSTPAFDSNDFILGFSNEKWNALNNDEMKPLYNRFRQAWCPGSSFKPIIAAIGLSIGAIDPDEDYKNAGLKWQKDKSWGNYYVRTLHKYSPYILENALIYSDNIYFAKAALQIGSDALMIGLNKIYFNKKIPFDITMAKSQYSNKGKIESEIQLADSGYGQGQILVNPLHLASLYTSFVNDGNVIKPYLLYEDVPKSEFYIQQAFSPEATEIVRKAIEKAVNNPHGTGYAAHRKDIILAGKTGTAEIKTSKKDTNGTELGWFGVFTVNKDVKTPILIMTMVEDVKGRGGSAYVVKSVKNVLDLYFEMGSLSNKN
jgi:cell division protein FtsI/penicillin-binding protein 2